MTPVNGSREYVSQRILTATPEELIRMLYEAATQAVDQALAALRAGDILKRGQAVTKASEILTELRVSLRREVDEQYSNTLSELYGYLQHQLMKAHAEQSEKVLLEVSRLLNTLLEGWVGMLAKGGPASAQHAAAGSGVNGWSPYASPSAEPIPRGRSWQL